MSDSRAFDNRFSLIVLTMVGEPFFSRLPFMMASEAFKLSLVVFLLGTTPEFDWDEAWKNVVISNFVMFKDRYKLSTT